MWLEVVTDDSRTTFINLDQTRVLRIRDIGDEMEIAITYADGGSETVEVSKDGYERLRANLSGGPEPLEEF